MEFSVEVSAAQAKNMGADLRLILDDLGLSDRVRVERG